ncbi:hypothetical protein OSB04_008007 [Centaurea solstitialis]|uniref:Uncharacterized protein n=1 Tax=Centaurea solstitialis TaxID=347529 RepID=A0AA38WJ31_9ASTR|nr:hypothetical protein OSB04_008007 [Centaurea solstitialis]
MVIERFGMEKETLWEGGPQHVEGGRLVWCNIIKVRHELEKIDLNFTFWKEVGREDETGFWRDIWVGNERLDERFKRLFLLETIKEGSIAEKRE